VEAKAVKRAEYNGWLLETADATEGHKPHRAWISDPKRYVVGYAGGATEADAVRAAFHAASHHYRIDLDALAALEQEYFGPEGMLALHSRGGKPLQPRRGIGRG
jgi:hypothetical protein